MSSFDSLPASRAASSKSHQEQPTFDLILGEPQNEQPNESADVMKAPSLSREAVTNSHHESIRGLNLTLKFVWLTSQLSRLQTLAFITQTAD